MLAAGESVSVDFKRSPDGVSADDVVSFANAESGGTILIGIDEQNAPGGAQIGVVKGCDVSDGTILQITNKALSCLPPVAISIHIENLDEVSFLRIEVPSSVTKPHCTPKGIYCRRDGSRNRPLHPAELLKIFLESEARSFAEKFETAADRITSDLQELESSLDQSIKSMADQLGWTDLKFDDTESTLNSVLAYTKATHDESGDISTRLRALFRQDSREDPVRIKAHKTLVDAIVEQLTNDPALFKHLTQGKQAEFQTRGKAAVELDETDVRSAVQSALEIVKKRKAAEASEQQ